MQTFFLLLRKYSMKHFNVLHSANNLFFFQSLLNLPKIPKHKLKFKFNSLLCTFSRKHFNVLYNGVASFFSKILKNNFIHSFIIMKHSSVLKIVFFFFQNLLNMSKNHRNCLIIRYFFVYFLNFLEKLFFTIY